MGSLSKFEIHFENHRGRIVFLEKFLDETSYFWQFLEQTQNLKFNTRCEANPVQNLKI